VITSARREQSGALHIHYASEQTAHPIFALFGLVQNAAENGILPAPCSNKAL
jgi:hypothetical protein